MGRKIHHKGMKRRRLTLPWSPVTHRVNPATLRCPVGILMARPTPPDPLPLRWAVVLLSGAILAIVGWAFGQLTLAETASWPTALLTGLAAAGVTVRGMRPILGSGTDR